MILGRTGGRAVRRLTRRQAASGRPAAEAIRPGEPRPQPRRFPLLLPTEADGPALLRLRAPADLSVPRRLQLEGLAGYEPETLACFLAVCDVAPPGPVWDVGANVGIYALLAAVSGRREVVAFEPTRQTAAVARRWLRRADGTARVHRIALGERDATATLYLSTASDSSNSTAAGFRESHREVAVPQRSVDSLVAEGVVAPTVLKIDTETTEPRILRGAAAFIAAQRPWLLCEALPGRTEDDLMAAMAPHGYTWHLIAPQTPFPARQRIEGHPSLYMWLFAPGPIPDTLWQRIHFWRERLSGCTPQAARLALGERRASRTADRGLGQ